MNDWPPPTLETMLLFMVVLGVSGLYWLFRAFSAREVVGIAHVRGALPHAILLQPFGLPFLVPGPSAQSNLVGHGQDKPSGGGISRCTWLSSSTRSGYVAEWTTAFPGPQPACLAGEQV